MAPARRVVRLLAGDTPWPWTRQTPAGDGIFGDSQFLFDLGDEPHDWLVVFEAVPRRWSRSVDPARSIFVTGEPTSVKRYHPKFLAQFGTVLTTDADTPHPNAIISELGLPWHVGMQMGRTETYGAALNFADFAKTPAKSKLCSVICSNKAFTPLHRQRLAFAEKLRSAFGDRMDFFGRGFREIADKDEALADYRYHIALENSAIDHYWTEKLADPLLRGCFPIYWGAPNIESYFPADAMLTIDIARPDAALASIAALLETDADQRHRAALDEARRRVLWDHNLFAILDQLISRQAQHPSQLRIVLRREEVLHYSWPRRLLQKTKRLVMDGRAAPISMPEET